MVGGGVEPISTPAKRGGLIYFFGPWLAASKKCLCKIIFSINKKAYISYP
jgi:hypothetical protein